MPPEELEPLDSSDADEPAETRDIDLVSSLFGSIGTTPPPPPARWPFCMGDDLPLQDDENALKMLDRFVVASSLSLSLSVNMEPASELVSECASKMMSEDERARFLRVFKPCNWDIFVAPSADVLL